MLMETNNSFSKDYKVTIVKQFLHPNSKRNQKELFFSEQLAKIILQMSQEDIVAALNFITLLRLIVCTNSNRIAIPFIAGFTTCGKYESEITIRYKGEENHFSDWDIGMPTSKEEVISFSKVKKEKRIFVVRNGGDM